MNGSESPIQGDPRVSAEAFLLAAARYISRDAAAFSLPIVDEGRQPIAWNDTGADYPDECIHQLFERQADRTPSAPAILFRRERLTYRDLNARANQVARHLRTRGVTRETLVGVCIERSADMIVALLGILKAGGGYVPLDAGYPAAHVTFMREDSRVQFILTHERFAVRVAGQVQVICLDRDRAVLDEQSGENLPPVTTPDDLAYVIYTSGTTGQPKGVIGLHRGAVNRLAWMWRAYPFGADEVCCQKTSLSFVDSLSEIFAPLLKGIPTVILGDEAAKDPVRLVERLATSSVTRIVLVPSLLREILALADDLEHRLARLKVWVSSGEALSIDLCRLFRERLPNATLLNLYGSTEVSADVTCYDTMLLAGDAASVPLGRPIANTKIYILDGALQPVPVGASGELYVGGDGLARGYLNRPDLTAQRFLRNPFSAAPDARIYRTGDRARYLPDGNIEFLGRLDHQIKIRGFRVELGEVEAALTAHAAIREAVVTARQDRDAGTCLVAYIVPKDKVVPHVADLRNFCRKRLPDHMVPAAFVPLNKLPLTSSGKVDRTALPTPDRTRRSATRGTSVGPRTLVEEQLVAIWEETLGMKEVGVTDDFFDLGGHSLLAARLAARIEKLYGRRLSVSAFAESPTIEHLADLLSQPEEARPWSPLIDLQPDGANVPFFLVHGIGGEVMSFATLGHHLAPAQPIIGVRAKGSDGVEEPLRSVESMAAFYLDAVRSVVPDGPYLIGGYSSGGTIALEMAQQLRAQCEEVALLAMIDSDAPQSGGGAERWRPRLIITSVRNLMWWLVDDDFFRSNWREKIARLGSKGRLVWARLVSLLSRRQVRVDIRDTLGVWRFPDQHRAFLEAHAGALAGYTAREYDGAITLIRARTAPLTSCSATDLGWARLAKGGLEIRMIPGAHDNILTEPRVRLLARELKQCLTSAHAKAVAMAASTRP